MIIRSCLLSVYFYIDAVEAYIKMLLDLLDSDNSMATRLALGAVRTCLNSLLNSSYHERGVRLLEKVFVHCTDNYWLVKVRSALHVYSNTKLLMCNWLVELSEQGPQCEGLYYGS